jgi:YD repeat-containing protein
VNTQSKTAVWFFSPALVAAQSTTDSGTPAGNAPGAPAGSYPLSGIETINPYNGGFNVSIPLLTIGGRGEASYTATLRISNDPWIVSSGLVECPPNLCWLHYATPSWWSGFKPGYGPGTMNVRQSGKDIYELNGNYYFGKTLTLMTFTAPDGTEYEFVDKLTGGEFGTAGEARGRIWTTRSDGVSATFIADGEIGDLYYYYPETGGTSNVWGATGDLFMKDGVRYRIEGGLVRWMRDRNGNKLTFQYDLNSRITMATDSLNRTVTFAYSVNAGSPYGICDTITWFAAPGTSRTIRISR